MLSPQVFYYSSYFIFLLVFIIIYIFFKVKLTIFRKILWLSIFILSLFFIEARFIEPNIITVEKTKINLWFQAKVAVISDLHIWVYKSWKFLKRVVDKINKQDIDFVVIPWDFTFVLDKKNNFNEMFFYLKDIKVPVYATLWNHDTQNPWPDIEKELTESLTKNWVIVLNNQKVNFWDINILWLWDNWAWEDNIWLINNYNLDDNLIVLAHNPDTTLDYENNIADITISWHTHGWQIKIPYLYKKVIPCEWNFDEWFYNRNWIKIFVTSWIWEVWLPMRFLNPPVIDILEFN